MSPSSKANDLPPGKPSIAGKKIIVVGAGIAGVAFALSLHKQWPKAYEFPQLVVYEREEKEGCIGREGYSLSIRGDSGGMQTLHKLDLLEKILPLSISRLGASDRAGSFHMWLPDWSSLLIITRNSYDETLPAQSMRIARDSLRRALIDALCEQVSVVWDHAFSRLEPLEDGRTRVYFTTQNDGNGESREVSDECDILIAADGASSRVRARLRPDDHLQFTGAVSTCGTARFPAGDVPEKIRRDWGCVFGTGDGVGLFVSPIDDTSAIWSISHMAKEPLEKLTHPISGEKAEAILQEALLQGKSFQEPFPSLVRATDPQTIMLLNASDKMPFSHGDLKDDGPCVVFLGDANHAVSPFAGNGANMALRDGWELAEEWCKPGSISEAVKRYDGMCIPRTTAALKMSHRNISLLHSTGLKLLAYKTVLRVTGSILRYKS